MMQTYSMIYTHIQNVLTKYALAIINHMHSKHAYSLCHIYIYIFVQNFYQRINF